MMLLAAILVDLFAGFALFKIVFHDRRDFAVCLKSFVSLSVFSMRRADYLDRWFASARFCIYLSLTAAAGVGTYYILAQFLPSLPA